MKYEPIIKWQRTKLFLYKLARGYSFLRFNLTINISNVCNRHCKFCPNWAPELIETYYLRWFKKQPDIMDVNKFEDMMKRMGPFRFFIKNIGITGRGDPTENPNLLKFCQIANHYKKSFTITSNGDKITPELLNELGKLEYLHHVRVSLFNVERAQYWLDLQEKSGAKIKFMNETRVKLDGYSDGYVSTNNPGTAKYSTVPTGFVQESFCRAPFSFNTLNTDGSIVTCITFFEIGNAFKEPLWKLMNNPRMRMIRKAALKMKIPEHLAYCRDCGVFMKYPKYQALNVYKKHTPEKSK